MAGHKEQPGRTLEHVEIDTIPEPRAGYFDGADEGGQAPGEEREGAEALAFADGGGFPAGIDVSGHQSTVDWAGVAEAGIAFAYAKATEGTSFVDPQFPINWERMKSANILRGAYHFFRPKLD